jgi:hypothetical protein
MSPREEMAEQEVLEPREAAGSADSLPSALPVDDFDLDQQQESLPDPDSEGTLSGSVASQDPIPEVPSVSPLGFTVLATLLAAAGAMRAGSARTKD